MLKPLSPAACGQLELFCDQWGQTLQRHEMHGPLMLVFLRHLGCAFCRQTLADLRDAREVLDQAGLRIGLVHMASDRQADMTFGLYGVSDVPRFRDAEKSLYAAFGLRRARLRDMARLELVKAGYEACVRQQHPMGVPRGDPLQMPGVFVVDRGFVRAAMVPSQPWDRPSYRTLAVEWLSVRAAA